MNAFKLHIKLQLLAILLVSQLQAQEILNPQFKVTQLKSIPQKDIISLHRDSKGFMWVGTLDGLIRFDGFSSKIYRIKQEQNSISSNMIYAVDEDHLGNIWIATFDKGLCRLDPLTETFTAYQQESNDAFRINNNDITSLLVDSNTIWLGNWLGVSRITFDREMLTIQSRATIPLDKICHNTEGAEIKRIFKGHNNAIWIGLNQYLVQLPNPYDQVSDINYIIHPGNTSSFCYVDSLLLTGGEGIYIVEQHSSDSLALNLLDYNVGNTLLYHNEILWVGNRNGVYSYEKQEGATWQVSRHFSAESDSYPLTTNLITSIANDVSGQIWVGTLGGGLNILSPRRKQFEYYSHTSTHGSLSNNLVRTLFEDSRENLWIGTEEGGLNYLTGKNKFNYTTGFKYFDIENYPIEYNRVIAIAEQHTPKSKLHDRLIWLGTSFPTFLISINPETIKAQPLPEFHQEIGFVFTIEVQNDSVLWVGTYGKGLWKLITDIDGKVTKHFHFTPNDSLPNSISSLIVRNILFDTQENLWVSTDKGLNRIVPKQVHQNNPDFIVYKQGGNKGQPSYDYILHVFESSKGKIWMGSMGGGLIGIEDTSADSLTFSCITTEHGLANNSVKAIQEDAEGNLWLSSNYGLTKYNPNNDDIINYDIEDGLQDNEFAEIVSCSRKNGQLIFGGHNGINVFYPNQVTRDTVKPKLFFTDFFISNERVEPGVPYNHRVVLKNSIEHTKSITLTHSQRSFSIGFAGLQFNSPQKNNYKYMLEGFDEKWFNATANYRIAKYTNIPRGDYTFKVLGSNCDNVWVNKPISLHITVKPHPLLSVWAYIIYSVLFILIVYAILRTTREIAVRKKEALIAGIEKRNAEELTQMKLRFFTNISHEFRTPLTLITIPLEKLLSSKKKFSSEEKKNFGIIKQNASLMLRLVNQLLDFRKLEQNKMQLNLQTLDIVGFAYNIYQSFEPLAEQKALHFEFTSDNAEITLAFDPAKMEKVIYNLLSNAIKFTPKQGNVKLSIEGSIAGAKVFITVSDTGIGINEKEQSLVFERYFQPNRKDNQNITGTGIGLALTKGLVELHKGEILFESKEGTGSTFTVSLPSSIANYQANAALTAIKEKDITNRSPETISPSTNDSLISENKNLATHKLLIIEDNIDLRETIAGIFTGKYTVSQAEDGLAGYEMCLEHNPDLIISDIMMPNMDGLELLTKVKNDERISHIPVILLTAKGSIEDQIEGHLSGADAYIPKPFDPDFLMASVISIIRNREQLRAKFQKEIEINPMVISNSPADVTFMDKILTLIEKNLSEPDFNVDKLADTYGVSRVHLNRKIKALTGESPNRFLRDIRLKHAAELLKQNKLNVSEITWMVGYSDLGTFRKRFKEKFGVSPSDFAKQ